MLDGEAPAVEILSPTVLRYSWSKPNPEFLPALAGARPLYLYRPAHYLKAMHEDYADPAHLQQLVAKHHQRTWAPLHNTLPNMSNFATTDLRTLHPRTDVTAPTADPYVLPPPSPSHPY